MKKLCVLILLLSTSAGATERLTLGRPLLAPLELPAVETSLPPRPISTPIICQRGVNLAATSLRLANDFTAERGVVLRGGVTNTGDETLYNVLIRFYLGDPATGGVQIGTDLLVPSIAPAATAHAECAWVPFLEREELHFIVDPEDQIAELDEEDNRDALFICLRGDVPWMCQEVNGYCNFASLGMLFNFYGADHTVYEAVEFASCPHSFLYIDEKFITQGGVYLSQQVEDYEFAGGIHNLAFLLEVGDNWAAYWQSLRLWLDEGQPFLTGVDPYYLPQPDYDPLRAYGLHGAHAIVVTGYTDSSVVINDPGVGIDLGLGAPLPNPELRGADVVVDLADFALAASMTLGSPYVQIGYEPVGPMPDESAMLGEVIPRSLLRITGEVGSYGAWPHIWPAGWTVYLGIPAFPVAAADMDLATFEARFDEVLASMGGNLSRTIDALAVDFVEGIFLAEIGWDAAAAYYATLPYPAAGEIVTASAALVPIAARIRTTYINMLIAIGNAGGDPSVAGPFLPQLAADCALIAPWEEIIRDHLITLTTSMDAAASVPPPARARCAPNPFVAATEITLERGVAPAADLRIHDATGRFVRTLTSARGGRATWDGRDDHGQPVKAGLYYLRDAHGPAGRVMKLR